MKLHRYVDHQRLHIVTKDVIPLSISVLLLFRHYISHKITFGAPAVAGYYAVLAVLLLSLYSSSVKSRYVFSRSVKVCHDRGSLARYGLSQMVLRFIPACHVLLGPLTFCYVVIKFCYVYQVLSRFSTIKRGR